MCASPRCNHILRTPPPTLSRAFAEGHDAQMRDTFAAMLGRPEAADSHLVDVPFLLGGLGLRSARRTAAQAYLGSAADALPEIRKHFPCLAARFLGQLTDSDGQCQSISEANGARQHLVRAGFQECPSWFDIYDGARPAPAGNVEPGEWAHGWQYFWFISN